MPSFDDSTTTAAEPEEVWKALYDPARYPSWWVGWATVEPGDDGAGTRLRRRRFGGRNAVQSAHVRVTPPCAVCAARALSSRSSAGTSVSA